MKKILKNLILIFTAFVIISCSGMNDKLTVISLSSLNGNIFPIEKDSVKIGGFSLLSSKIKELNKNNRIKTDIIGNSNFIYGTREAYLTSGKSVIDLMNILNFSCLVIGHREFYYGYEELAELAKQAQFPFISSNIVNKDSTRISFIRPYIILKDGKSAVIGISTSKVIKANLEKDVSSIAVLDPADAVARYSAELKEKGVGIIIVAGDFNCGEGSGSNLTTSEADRLFSLRDVDVFLTTTENNRSCSLEGKKPVYSCGINGSELISFSVAGDKVENIKKYAVNSGGLQPDKEIASQMAEINNMIEALTGKVLGTATDDIPHALGDKFSVETPLGSLISDIMREYTGTEIFFMNSGKVRNGFEKGPVTLGDLYDIMPYEGNIVSVKMNGEQILAVLESSCSLKMSKSFLQVSGLSFTFDSSAKPGSRVQKGSVKIKGKPLDRKRVYTVSLTDYIYQGGDSYNEFIDLGVELDTVHQKQMREIIKDYILTRGSISKGENSRITDVSKL